VKKSFDVSSTSVDIVIDTSSSLVSATDLVVLSLSVVLQSSIVADSSSVSLLVSAVVCWPVSEVLFAVKSWVIISLVPSVFFIGSVVVNSSVVVAVSDVVIFVSSVPNAEVGRTSVLLLQLGVVDTDDDFLSTSSSPEPELSLSSSSLSSSSFLSSGLNAEVGLTLVLMLLQLVGVEYTEEAFSSSSTKISSSLSLSPLSAEFTSFGFFFVASLTSSTCGAGSSMF